MAEDHRGLRRSLQSVIRALDAAGLDPQADEIADCLWLAAQVAVARPPPAEKIDTPAPSASHIEESGQPGQTPSDHHEAIQPGQSAPARDRYEPATTAMEASAALHRWQPPDEDQAAMASEPLSPPRHASPFRAPGVAPLPNALQLSRALRPLRRRIPSRRARLLDVEATVERIVDRGLWLPVTRPRPEPWLNLDLLVDTADSMAVWGPAIAALHRLLNRQDAFARIRLLYLRRGPTAAQGFRLYDRSGRAQPIEPRGTHPQRRRLLWVLSDCVEPDWTGTGPIAALLHQRARRGQVFLIQMLPQRMWPYTSLGVMPWTNLRGAPAARSNSALIADREPWPPLALRLPVMTLDAHAFKTGAALIRGRADTWCAGLAFGPSSQTAGYDATGEAREGAAQDTTEPTVAPVYAPPVDLTDEQRLDIFDTVASPEARQLARSLSALPLSLPIMRLAQQILMGRQSQLMHLAEVFLGGILQPLPMPQSQSTEADHPERRAFDFIGTIRERLLADLAPDAVLSIHRRMSAAVEQHLGQLTDFFALIALDGPGDGATGLRLGADSLPFARIRLKILRRLGGSFLPLAVQLAKEIDAFDQQAAASAQHSAVWSTDVLLVSRDRPTADALLEVYRQRSHHEPAAHRVSGRVCHDLGRINGASVLHCEIPEHDDWEAARMELEAMLTGVQTATVIEIGLAEHGALSDDSDPGLLIVEAMQDGQNADEVAARAAPHLLEGFELADTRWQEARIQRGILWQSEAGVSAEWRMHFQEAAFEPRPGLALQCSEGGIAWIGLRGLVDLGSEASGSTAALVDSEDAFNGPFRPSEKDPAQLPTEQVASLLLFALEQLPFAPKRFRDDIGTGDASGPAMIWLPGGTFTMGSPEGVGKNDEHPAHEVTLSHYAVGQHPVTVGDFRRFVEAEGYRTEAEEGDGAWIWNKGNLRQERDASWRNPYMSQDDSHPVVCISWNDARAYCEWLSNETGQTYGLLTEAQWEHACCAGRMMAYSFGDDAGGLEAHAWYRDNAGDGTHPVGRKAPNAWQLYDMHGNVLEWCEDWYGGYSSEPEQDPSGPESGSYRVIRGGSWFDDAGICRSAYRNWVDPSYRGGNLGFRLSRTGPLHSYPFTLGPPEPEIRPEPIAGLRDPLPNGARGPAMVWLPGGVFTMGQDDGPYDDEKPAHPVRVDAFSIGQYPVTFAEYDRFCEATQRKKPEDQGWGRDERPVINLSWKDVQSYCDWLSQETGEQYRLATEAEWEYACRAGTETPWYCGADEAQLGDYAWYDKNSDSRTHPVGQKHPNAWQLYDMHGNVWEWCQDWFSGSYYEQLSSELGQGSESAPSRSSTSEARSGAARELASDNPSGPESGSLRVVRGGSWGGDADDCRSAYRFRIVPSIRHIILGFRLSRTGPWRSHPITLGGAQPIPDTQTEPQTRSPETAPRASAAGPTGRSRYAPREVFRDRFRIVGRDGAETPIDAPELVYLSGGTFLMGDERGQDDEKPVHPVRLDAFAIGRTPVIWGDYRRFCEATDRHWPEWLEKGNQYHLDTGSNNYYRQRGISADALDLPVVGVSWDDAVAFCAWLSEQTGERYALPTEAQWEYACRAGTTTRWSCGDDEKVLGEHAWYAANAGGKLHSVGQKRPNPWGLLDMHGNVGEWCSDWYESDYYQQLAAGSEQASGITGNVLSRVEQTTSGSEQTPSENSSGPGSGSPRVVRGGSWIFDAGFCRSAARFRYGPSIRDDDLGFRLSRTV